MEMNRIRRGIVSTAGSVMVEYVVVLGFLGVPVFLLFIPGFYSGELNASNGYDGLLGSAMLSMMQRILEGIAMPIPF